MTELTRLALAVLACYRLAQLLPTDDGPGEVFERTRESLGRRAARAQATGRHALLWRNLAEFARCPYCIGVWAALLCAALTLWPSPPGDLFLAWWGIAGGQTLLEIRVPGAGASPESVEGATFLPSFEETIDNESDGTD